MKLSTIEVTGNVKTNNNVKIDGSIQSARSVKLDGGMKIASGGSLSKSIYVDTTAHWNAQRDLIGRANCIYVYSDYTTIDGVNTPAMKVGDGLAYLLDLPFVIGNDVPLNDHINNTDVHIQDGERMYWNNKVTCFLSAVDEENVVFTKENISSDASHEGRSN